MSLQMDCTSLELWDVIKSHPSLLDIGADLFGIHMHVDTGMPAGVNYYGQVSPSGDLRMYGDFEMTIGLSIPAFTRCCSVIIGSSLLLVSTEGDRVTGHVENTIYFYANGTIRINNGYKTLEPNITLPWEGTLKIVRSGNNFEYWVGSLCVRSFVYDYRYGEIDYLEAPVIFWNIIQPAKVSFQEFLGHLNGLEILGDVDGTTWPLQTGKDYVLVTPFPGGTMTFEGQEYKFVKYLERFDKEQHQIAGVPRTYEYGGPVITYGEQPYSFLASGITDKETEGGFSEYLPDTKRTVQSILGRENFVNFYYVLPSLSKVDKPIWVKKVITWKDVPNASHYEIKLYLNDVSQCIDTQVVPVGIQRMDYTYFIETFMPAGTYFCTVQALAKETINKVITWNDAPGVASYTVNLVNSKGEVVYTDSVTLGVQRYDFGAIIPGLPTGVNYYGIAIPNNA